MESRRPALWLMFFCIGLGLGYPVLNRYDPSKIEGTSDSQGYFQMVVGGPQAAGGHWRYRVLVPALARPIYRAAEGRVGTWNAASLGLLVVNAAFCASTAVTLVAIAHTFGFPFATGAIAAFAYLLDFEVANFQLAGMVDSAEAFLMACLVLVLARRRWNALPVLALIGGLAKETFVPLALLAAGGWIWREPDRRPWVQLGAMAAAGLAAVVLVRTIVEGRAVMLPEIISSERNVHGVADALGAGVRVFTSWTTWLTFLWMAPFAWRGMGRLPGSAVLATAVGLAGAFALAVWNDAGANAARPLFTVAAPCVCLAFAVGVTDR